MKLFTLYLMITNYTDYREIRGNSFGFLDMVTTWVTYEKKKRNAA